MAGLRQIAERTHPHCPHCRASLDLSEFLEEVFERILAAITSGERVYIVGFGTFVARTVEGRRIRTFDGTERRIAGRRRIKFKASENAKQIINEAKEVPTSERDAPERSNDQSDQEAAGDGLQEGLSRSQPERARDDRRRRAKPGSD